MVNTYARVNVDVAWVFLGCVGNQDLRDRHTCEWNLFTQQAFLQMWSLIQMGNHVNFITLSLLKGQPPSFWWKAVSLGHEDCGFAAPHVEEGSHIPEMLHIPAGGTYLESHFLSHCLLQHVDTVSVSGTAFPGQLEKRWHWLPQAEKKGF